MDNSRSLGGRIVLAAAAVGVLGLVGGVVVPGILDPTTVQGPLLGIFVTGPLGVIAGGHAGIVWSAQRQKRVTSTELAWLMVFAGLILLFNEFGVVLGSASIVLPSVFLLTTATAAILLTYQNGSRVLTRLLVAVAIATPLLFISGIVAPVAANPLYAGPSSSTRPHYAFVLDNRLDARRRVPPWRIDGSKLHLEWAAIVIVSAVVSPLLVSRERFSRDRGVR